MSDSDKIFDGLLVVQYRSGKNEALELLVKRHHKKLCKHAHWYVHDFDISKDIAQDCWTTIINKIGGLKDPNTFGSWALRIVTRKALDLLNKNARNKERLKQYEFNSTQYEIEEDRLEDIKKLKKGINTLTVDQQVVLRLFYTEDYSLREISEILAISEGTIKSRLFHAREKLKTIIK